jgi:hypothetical protein
VSAIAEDGGVSDVLSGIGIEFPTAKSIIHVGLLTAGSRAWKH